MSTYLHLRIVATIALVAHSV